MERVFLLCGNFHTFYNPSFIEYFITFNFQWSVENLYFSYEEPVSFKINGESDIRNVLPEDYVDRWKNDRVGAVGFYPGAVQYKCPVPSSFYKVDA